MKIENDFDATKFCAFPVDFCQTLSEGVSVIGTFFIALEIDVLKLTRRFDNARGVHMRDQSAFAGVVVKGGDGCDDVMLEVELVV